MELKSYHSPDALYKQCIVCYVKHLKPNVKTLDEIDGLQMLPPNILADIYLTVSIRNTQKQTTHSWYRS